MPAEPAKPVAALVGDPFHIQRVYGDAGRARLATFTDLRDPIIEADDLSAERLAGVRWIFSTWGMPEIAPEVLAELPDLEVVFYAAGSVKPFANPLFDRGVRIVSAWKANGRPVAEFCLGQILLASKGWHANHEATRRPFDMADRYTPALPVGGGVWNTPVALLGFGAVGRVLAELLQPFRFELRVVDPFVDATVLDGFHAERVTMEEAFATCEIVSNHLPNLPSLEKVFGRDLFASMLPGATFLNTGRGAQVDEAALAAVLSERPDLTALLDVTFPEPPLPGSPLYELPNVHLSSHIAGSIGREVHRLAESVMDEAEALLAGRELQHEITASMLDSMA